MDAQRDELMNATAADAGCFINARQVAAKRWRRMAGSQVSRPSFLQQKTLAVHGPTVFVERLDCSPMLPWRALSGSRSFRSGGFLDRGRGQRIRRSAGCSTRRSGSGATEARTHPRPNEGRPSWARPRIACLGFCFVAGSPRKRPRLSRGKTVGHFSGTCLVRARPQTRRPLYRPYRTGRFAKLPAGFAIWKSVAISTC